MPKRDVPHILLVNPWIHDFAAYDVWAKPLGLLYLAGMLEQAGFAVSYLDCLDRFHPKALPGTAATRCGRGPYLKQHLPKPPGLEDIPRRFSRYGVPPAWLRADLEAGPRPDLILVTSLMTYWYPGLRETIECLRQVFGDTPLLLGGIYATLCPGHARAHSGADEIIHGGGEARILDLASRYTGYQGRATFDPHNLDTWPYPAFHRVSKLAYGVLQTSRGCPFDCAYCASRFINPTRQTRNPEAVVAEIRYWHRRFGVNDFAFYDDALLVDAARHALPILEGIVRAGLKVRFHTPNALHIREISPAVARLMKRAGFETLRLGLETTAFETRRGLDRKVAAAEFHTAVAALRGAGFDAPQIGAYLLVGLPGQRDADLVSSIAAVRGAGLTPVLAHYSPIPHTRLWPAARATSRYDLAADPIFTNNAIMPCQAEPFTWERLTHLKRLAGSL